MKDGYGGIDQDDVTSLAELSAMVAWSFGFPLADAEPWFRRGGLENVRVVRRSGKIAACLLMIPQAQFFAGRSVRAVGIAGVATPAESRGDGAAKALMTATLRELHERGIATSNLYPATVPLYRGVGYESAGTRNELTVPLASLPERDRALPLRAMTSDDDAAVEACYRAHASRTNGHLDRSAYVWQRVRSPRGETPRGFVVGKGADVDGYAIVFEKRTPGAMHYALVASDLVARTPAAARRLLTFFADHGTLASSVTWNGSPSDPFVHLLGMPVWGYTSRVLNHWMMRIVDVPAALAARGYVEGARGELELDVVDDVIGANSGRFVVRVQDGRAEVARGGSGALRMHVRALAALYSAHMTPDALATAGQLEGGERDLAIAASLFVAPAPWMPDFF